METKSDDHPCVDKLEAISRKCREEVRDALKHFWEWDVQHQTKSALITDITKRLESIERNFNDAIMASLEERVDMWGAKPREKIRLLEAGIDHCLMKMGIRP